MAPGSGSWFSPAQERPGASLRAVSGIHLGGSRHEALELDDYSRIVAGRIVHTAVPVALRHFQRWAPHFHLYGGRYLVFVWVLAISGWARVKGNFLVPFGGAGVRVTAPFLIGVNPR